MKILVIWRLLTVGGVNAGWRNRTIYFKKHGIETYFLYSKDHGGMHIMEDIAEVYLTKNEDEIINIITSNQYDAIIVVDTGAAYQWIQKAKYKGPVIIEARTPELIKLQPHVKSFDGIDPLSIIVPSDYQKRLVSILTNDIPTHVIYNGINTTFFRPLQKDEIDYDTIPFLPSDKKIIGWIGRLDRRKNWPKLLEIANKIKRDRKDVEIWVIGGAESTQRTEFTIEWQLQGLTDIVKWFPVIPYQQMPHMYAKIRESGGCTLATTKSESFGNTFIESMACGIPVVASNMMPVTELVKKGETGLLFRGQNSDDALKQIYDIIDYPERHEAMSKAAVDHVQANFAIEVVAEHYVNLIKRLKRLHSEMDGEVNFP